MHSHIKVNSKKNLNLKWICWLLISLTYRSWSCICIVGNCVLLRTQSISGTGTLRVVKPMLLVVLEYKNLKLKEEEEEDTGLQAGLYAPYRSHVAYGPSVNQVLTGYS